MLAFNYKRLQEVGYNVKDTGRSIHVHAGENATPIFQRDTLNQIYSDLQDTRISPNDFDDIVQDFVQVIEAKHIYALAVQDKPNEEL